MKGYEKDYYSTIYGDSNLKEGLYPAKAKIALNKYFKGFPKDIKILDFGCGLGHNTYLFPNSVGYDISEFSLDFCRKMGKQVINNIEDAEDNSFDVVFSSHTLEHVENPYETLEILKRKLKPDGRLILILPVEHHRKASFKIDINQHLFCWNFRTINNLLIKRGFEILKNKYCHGIGYQKLYFISKISQRLFECVTTFISRILFIKEMMIVAKVKNPCY